MYLGYKIRQKIKCKTYTILHFIFYIDFKFYLYFLFSFTLKYYKNITHK